MQGRNLPSHVKRENRFCEKGDTRGGWVKHDKVAKKKRTVGVPLGTKTLKPSYYKRQKKKGKKDQIGKEGKSAGSFQVVPCMYFPGGETKDFNK